MCRHEAKARISLVEAVKAKKSGMVYQLLQQKDYACFKDVLEEVDGDVHHNATALFWAAAYGLRSIVVILLQKGADINSTNITGVTPLHAAVDNRHTTIAR